MNDLITPVQKVRTPMTKQDVDALTGLCERLIQDVQSVTNDWQSVFAKQSAEDIMDVIIDLKVDLQTWGDENAVLMHEDGFCDPFNTKK